ncbi:MAG: HEPN domain-containing protein [Fretibacterium sp.]|nr:HEPN domain-containing protein [Fretibacterium sp.]
MMLKHDERDVMVKLYMEKSMKALRSAKNTLEDDPDNSINRSYYSMFYAAQGALVAKGFSDFRKHQTVISKFGEIFVKTGFLDKELGKNIKRVENLRYRADYNPKINFSSEEAREQVERAEQFVSAVNKLLNQGLK